jgi:hypothetical protein
MINLFNMKNEILGWIAALSAIMLTIFTAFMRGKSQGKQQAEVKKNEQELKQANEIIKQDAIIRDGAGDIERMSKSLSTRLRNGDDT